ncbi:hypothetical protein Droror1_Dr00022827 [Drosera rotundifolia]
MLDTCACYDDDDYFSQSNSSVDILVATPGRLMDHISSTKGFTLEHLRYLVVDETDRLLREAYQSWLPTVVKLTQSSDAFSDSHFDASFLSAFGSFKTIRKCGVERGFKDRPYPRLAKMVLSATSTQDPSKLAQLDLHHPLLVTTGQERYRVPEKLESFKLVCETEKKPLFLVALLQSLSGEKCIVFTSSVESTHRLCTLLKLFGDLHVKIKEYSGLQHQRVRSKTLEAFRKGVVQVLVSSDAITRGTDIEGVRNVINYDKPPYVKTYIHRAGRTARAGQAGRCFTLLSKNEVKSFEKLLQKADIKLWTDYSLPSGSVNALEPLYSSALEKLKENVDAETSKKRRFNLKSTGRRNGRSNRS